MGLLHRLDHWSVTHHPKWLVLLRVALGISLFIKGISFLSNSVALEQVITNSILGKNAIWLSSVIVWLHLFGGFMISIGLFTRLAVALQIPILAGAVIFVNASRGLFAGESELSFSIIILALLIFFFVEGGGPISLDSYFRKHPR